MRAACLFSFMRTMFRTDALERGNLGPPPRQAFMFRRGWLLCSGVIGNLPERGSVIAGLQIHRYKQI